MNLENGRHHQNSAAYHENDRRLVGMLALIVLILTVIWLILLIHGIAKNGPVTTLEGAMAVACKMDSLYYFTYFNAALITLVVTALFAGFYVQSRHVTQLWSTVAVVFVPPYTLLNLFVYLSQITIVPRLFTISTGIPVETSTILLDQMLQQWPDSIVSMLNNLGYAILGIPSIIFGILFLRRTRLGGTLLALNGAACIIGFAGIIMHNRVLSSGSIVGGVLFLLALIPLTLQFLKIHDKESPI